MDKKKSVLVKKIETLFNELFVKFLIERLSVFGLIKKCVQIEIIKFYNRKR